MKNKLLIKLMYIKKNFQWLKVRKKKKKFNNLEIKNQHLKSFGRKNKLVSITVTVVSIDGGFLIKAQIPRVPSPSFGLVQSQLFSSH